MGHVINDTVCRYRNSVYPMPIFLMILTLESDFLQYSMPGNSFLRGKLYENVN